MKSFWFGFLFFVLVYFGTPYALRYGWDQFAQTDFGKNTTAVMKFIGMNNK